MRHVYLLILSLVLIITGVAGAQVLATVDDSQLTWDDLVEIAGGEENIQYLGVISLSDANEILMSWVREEIIIRTAETENLDEDPIVTEILEQARRQILLEAYLVRAVENIEVSRLDVENYIAEWYPSFQKELHLRHILVAEEELARAMLARLNAGSSFEEVAQQYSICPSSEDGGDLGWIRRGQAVLSFEEAAFRLEPGEYSDLVKTSMGYHIIEMLEEMDISSEITDEEIMALAEAELINYRQELVLTEILDEISGNYNITVYPERLLDKL